jgi:hypothetical protein
MPGARSWRGRRWPSATPEAGRRNGCGAFDPIGRRLFVFGGKADRRTSEPGLFAFDARPENPGWSRLEPPGAPPIRSSGFGFYDQAGDRIFLGFGNADEPYRNLTPLRY